MSESILPPAVSRVFGALAGRVARLEASAGIPQYTTALRPPAAQMQGKIVFDTTLGKHVGSDGTSWNALY